ncbi:hypothetical protein ACFX2A_004535 [Malus domestica]
MSCSTTTWMIATKTTVTGVSLFTPRAVLSKVKKVPRAFHSLNVPTWRSYSSVGRRMTMVRPISATPDKLSKKVAKNIKNVEETCLDDLVSGKCVTVWDEVEELSAAFNMDRRSWPWKKKASDKAVAEKAIVAANSFASQALAELDKYRKPKYVQISIEQYSHLTGLED